MKDLLIARNEIVSRDYYLCSFTKGRSALHVLIFVQEYVLLILIEIGKVSLERIIKLDYNTG